MLGGGLALFILVLAIALTFIGALVFIVIRNRRRKIGEPAIYLPLWQWIAGLAAIVLLAWTIATS